MSRFRERPLGFRASDRKSRRDINKRTRQMAVYQVMNIHFAVMKSRSTFRSSRLFRGEIKRFRWEPVFDAIVRRLDESDVSLKM